MLKFNINALNAEILKILEQELYTAKTAWEFEVKSKVTSNFYGKYADVSSEIDRKTQALILYLKANPYVLADSYGTGSFMLDDNPGLAEYMASDSWNPERRGKAIVGRRSGTYTNMFGQKRVSSGTFKGKNIEGRRVYEGGLDSNDYYISPTRPSYAIQLAEQYLFKQWLPIAYKNTVKRIDFAKFLIES